MAWGGGGDMPRRAMPIRHARVIIRPGLFTVARGPAGLMNNLLTNVTGPDIMSLGCDGPLIGDDAMSNALTSFRAIEAQEIAANIEGYLEYGAESRAEYLAMLADEYGIDLDVVQAMADVLGPNEDFDGLVTSLEDMEA